MEYFDFYLFHNVCELNIDAYLDEKYGIFNYLIKQRKISRIKHLGFSAHGGYSVMKRKVLSDEEKRVILDIADRMVSATAIPCTACRYCSSHCPQGLDIPALLALYNEHCSTEGGFIAPMAIMAYEEGKRPNACIGCRSCEAVCPQQIKISEAMEDFTKKLMA